MCVVMDERWSDTSSAGDQGWKVSTVFTERNLVIKPYSLGEHL